MMKTSRSRSRSDQDQDQETFSYDLHGHTFQSVDCAKYLGVTIEKNITWSKHIDNIHAKANRLLGFLRRNLRVATTKTKELTYKALVSPVIEYSCCVWDPSSQKDIDKLEKIQRRAARYVLNRHQKTESVEKLKWQTLQERHRTTRLNMFYMIHNRLVNVKCNKLKPLPTRSQHKGHNAMYERITGRTDYCNNSFFPRTIRDWNSLPQAVVESPSLSTFSARVARH